MCQGPRLYQLWEMDLRLIELVENDIGFPRNDCGNDRYWDCLL